MSGGQFSLTERGSAGTTHLLIGSSSTPNSVPAFLTGILPKTCHTLLALDISANFLVALPPALASCENLEELNIASNPLRVLPVFLSRLTSLRVLIADATLVSTLPDSLCDLDRLHTLSVRRNRMHSLPSWLCLLPSLQELYLDGNPFQGPWQALVEPLLTKAPVTPIYPPTPPVPLFSSSVPASSLGTETDTDDSEGACDAPRQLGPLNEDETIHPTRVPLGRSATSPAIIPPVPATTDRGLTRTRTTPRKRAHNHKTSMGIQVSGEGVDAATSRRHWNDPSYPVERELRKMKSAGELRTSFERPREAPPDPPIATPIRPAMSASASSSSLLNVSTVLSDTDRLPMPKRYGSLGVSALSPPRGISRPILTQSLFDDKPGGSVGTRGSLFSSVTLPPTSPPRPATAQNMGYSTPSPIDRPGSRQLQVREPKDKSGGGGRWGFLKKMSMGKMRPDSPALRPSTSLGRPSRLDAQSSPVVASATPQIDVRFSTTGSLGPMLNTTPTVMLSPLSIPGAETASNGFPVAPSAPGSPGGLLSAGASPISRTSRRRSFLPVDGSSMTSLTIPSPSSFLREMVLIGKGDSTSELSTPPSSALPPINESDFVARREEERAKETYTRALRSVMAYLRDMNDLNLSQGTVLSGSGLPGEDSPPATRSRRPTVVDRTPSEPSITRAASISGQLRSPETLVGLRCGTASQTISVATTDSNSSSEERKCKDDKCKRALIIREIVEYVTIFPSVV